MYAITFMPAMECCACSEDGWASTSARRASIERYAAKPFLVAPALPGGRSLVLPVFPVADQTEPRHAHGGRLDLQDDAVID